MCLFDKNCCGRWAGSWWLSLLMLDDRRTLMRGLRDGGALWVSFLMQFAFVNRISLSDWIDDLRISNDSFDGTSSLVGDGLQLFNTSLRGCSLFLRFELPRRTFKLDLRDGAGDAAVTLMSIFVSCCSSSPDCSTHVGSMFAEPVGESFIVPESPKMVGQLFRSDLVMIDVRSRKSRSSRPFSEPNTDGGVKWIFGGSLVKWNRMLATKS